MATSTPARRTRSTRAPKDKFVRDDFVFPIAVDAGEDEVREVEVRLPSLTYLKPGQIRKIRRLSQEDAFFTLLEEMLDEDVLAAVDDMNPDEFRKMLEAWRKHSGVTLGESSASQS